jgi:ABC-type phosphate transport system substrate-binding protein
MRLIRPRLFCLFSLPLLLSVPVSALVLGGSDLLEGGIRTAIAEQANAAGLEIEMSLQGSLLGSRDLRDGKVDACILAMPHDGSLDIPNLRQFPIAFQVVAFAVHSNNPVTDLNYTQLTNLYGETGLLDSWSDLTPDPEWRDRNISLWASRSGVAMNLEIFNAVVLKGSALNQSVRYSAGDSTQLIAIVIEDPSALVMAPSIKLGAGVRFLAIKEDSGGQAYTPSEDNVFFGDYPLRLPFALVVSDSLSEDELNRLLQVFYSEQVTDALQGAFFMPIPETERRSVLRQAD